jgi:hypothetical protein
LNAVEQMLINLYNETKNRTVAPVITIDSNNEENPQRLQNPQTDLIPILAKNADGQWILTSSGKNLEQDLTFRMDELNESTAPINEQRETTTKTKKNSIDETIDSVLSRAVVVQTPSNTDQELVAQLSSNDATQTLSQLIQMGFGKQVSLVELKVIVDECEGRLDRCLNKLTKLV